MAQEARDEALEQERLAQEARDQALEQGKALKIARDQALESARAKGEFAATVSHELRTPLTGVLGMLALIADRALRNKQLDSAQTARSSAAMPMPITTKMPAASLLSSSEVRKRTAATIPPSEKASASEVFTITTIAAATTGRIR